MAAILLDSSGAVTILGELVAGGVTEHVRVNREVEPSELAGSSDDFAKQPNLSGGLVARLRRHTPSQGNHVEDVEDAAGHEPQDREWDAQMECPASPA